MSTALTQENEQGELIAQIEAILERNGIMDRDDIECRELPQEEKSRVVDVFDNLEKVITQNAHRDARRIHESLSDFIDTFSGVDDEQLDYELLMYLEQHMGLPMMWVEWQCYERDFDCNNPYYDDFWWIDIIQEYNAEWSAMEMAEQQLAEQYYDILHRALFNCSGDYDLTTDKNRSKDVEAVTAALFTVNRKTKRLRDLALNCYESQEFAEATGASKFKHELYRLKDDAIGWLYDNGHVDEIKKHGDMLLFKCGKYSWHTFFEPEDLNIDDLEEIEECDPEIEAKQKEEDELSLIEAYAILNNGEAKRDNNIE